AAELKEREDDAIRDAVKMQEEVGLKVATDGEFRRAMWHTDFLSRFINVDVVPGKIKVRFQSFDGETELEPPGTVVTGKLAGPRGGIFVDDFKFLASIVSAGVTPKITIPSPSTMHFRGGRDAIDRQAYPDMGEFYTDLARVYAQEVRAFANAGCSYLQIDEVNFAFLCDAKLREEVRTTIGEDPDRLPHTYAKLINASIAARPAEMVVCLHLCRGNAMSSWLAQGGYDPVAEVLFNDVAVDGYFLEYDTPRAGSFAPLRFVPKGKTVVLGLVTTKQGTMESKDDLKRRIDEASRYCPLEQLALSPQCGFASGAPGNKISFDDELRKLRLVVETAREVWASEVQ
ncbi:MAG: 5-methyltetrahydropteroyltriglutamate--homocysteine S-methyltransferase, partial [Xanthobacteraceae bacterium]|nr:5-methyltetrahydropteroyltriglutamate--homocysteine S-methyltransferase [Xanthobacteraceae bacterium]